jgi:hypothetical protein
MIEHEQALIHVSKMCEVKPNIQFYNVLILRRLRRGAKQEALVIIFIRNYYCF